MATRRPGWWEGSGGRQGVALQPWPPCLPALCLDPLPARTPQSEGALVSPLPDRVRRDPSARSVLAGAGGARGSRVEEGPLLTLMGVARGHPYSQRGPDGCLSVTIVHFEKDDLRVGWELHVSDARGEISTTRPCSPSRRRERGCRGPQGRGGRTWAPPAPHPGLREERLQQSVQEEQGAARGQEHGHLALRLPSWSLPSSWPSADRPRSACLPHPILGVLTLSPVLGRRAPLCLWLRPVPTLWEGLSLLAGLRASPATGSGPWGTDRAHGHPSPPSAWGMGSTHSPTSSRHPAQAWSHALRGSGSTTSTDQCQ